MPISILPDSSRISSYFLSVFQHFGEFSHPRGFPFPPTVTKSKNFAHFVDFVIDNSPEEVEDHAEDDMEDDPPGAVVQEDGDTPVSSLPPCKYGASCFRKNPAHLKSFWHPGDQGAPLIPAAVPAAPAKKTMKVIEDSLPDDDSEYVAPPAKAKAAPVKKTAHKASGPAAGAPKSMSIQGVTIAITGTLSATRNIIVKQIQNAGGVFCPTVTKATQFLVVENPNSGTAKLQKAEAMGVKVVGEDWLQARLDAFFQGTANAAPEDEDDEEEIILPRPAAVKKGAQNDDDDNGGDDPGDAVGGGGGAAPTPLTHMEDGDSIPITGGHGNYEVRFRGGVYYCTCTAWKMQNLPVDVRTCKHLRDTLGDEFETYRCGRPGNAPAKVQKVGAPGLLLANKWESQDPTGWWISEKLDGIRAYWDGTRFLSRLGNVFYAPEWFTKNLPGDCTLDGELFGGRKKFQATVSIVKSQDASDRWKTLVYKIFDIPSEGSKPFEQRMASLEAMFPAGTNPYIEICEQVLCTGKPHVDKELERVQNLGGEGLMLRQKGSKYVGSRSSTLLKVKGFEDDEALVIGYIDGKGKYAGMVGSLQCQLANGKTFNVGSGYEC